MGARSREIVVILALVGGLLVTAVPLSANGAAAAAPPVDGSGESALVAAPTPSSNTSANATWNLLAEGPAGLAARSFPAMASDPDLGGIVLFGGYNWSAHAALGDTWSYTNGTWSQIGLAFTSAPSARWGASLTYDAADGYLVLFGGRDSTGSLSDTWTLSASDARSGAGWVHRTPATHPSARAFGAAFYDPTSRSMIEYGGGCAGCGSGGGWTTDNQTWSYSGGSWANKTKGLGTTPGPYFGAYAAWDPALDGGVVYGGDGFQNNCTSYSNETWLYHGSWSRIVTNGSPDLVVSGGMAWDGIDDELVAFGGLTPSSAGCAADSNTSWIFKGYNWTDVTNASGAATSIGPRCCVGVAYDPQGEVVTMFGGDSQNTTYYNSTWTYPTLPFHVSASPTLKGYANVTRFGFEGTATGGEGPYSYRWSFGDNSTNATTQNATHIYAGTGTFRVLLTVSDAVGRESNLSWSAEVVTPVSLNAASTSLVGDAPFSVTFNATASGGFPSYHWTWAFGDGFTWNGANVTHTYSIGGTFNATVRVNDSFTGNATTRFTVLVYGRMVVSITPTATNVIAPRSVGFSSLLKGGDEPYTYLWTFTPGAVNSSQNANYTFETPGEYNVSLQVTDVLGYRATGFVTVNAYAPLNATAQVSTPIAVAPATEMFTALPVGGAPPLYYTWDFGDGSPTVPGLTTSHQYLQAGNYTVALTVHDSLGEYVNTSLPVEVVRPLAVAASANVTEGPSPFTVQLTAETTGGLAPLSYLWSLGDGTAALGESVTHTYANGTFFAKVTVTDNAGQNLSSTLRLTVYNRLTLTVGADPAAVELGNVTTLTATVSGGVPPVTLSWSNLPPGCLSRNAAAIDCLSTATGDYSVTVSAVDSVHENASSTIVLRVAAPVSGCCNGTMSTAAGPIAPAVYAAIAVGAVVVVGLAMWVAIRRRRPPTEPASEEPPPETYDS